LVTVRPGGVACRRLNVQLHVGQPPSRVSMVTDLPERWSRATVFPDMWVDPEEDPRNRDGVSPDGELPTLQHYLRDYRQTLQMKCQGLDPEQLARRSVPPSTMSLLGLLRHLAELERDWRNWILPGDPEPKLHGTGDAASKERPLSRRLSTTHSPISLASRRSPMQCWPSIRIWASGWGKDGIAVRELWVHRIEEYARHCGHADLLRECIDGRIGQ
jgi:Protein of unknown function (DUF664)